MYKGDKSNRKQGTATNFECGGFIQESSLALDHHLRMTVYKGIETPQGDTLIFLYIRRLGSFFWDQNFEFQYFWGVSENWHEDFVDIFGGVITKLDYILGSFLCILGSFLKVKVQNGGYFWGLLKFQIFFRVLKIPDIFGG